MNVSPSDTPYNDNFYNQQLEGSLRSAHLVLERTLKLLDARSALDVGCGLGAWSRTLLDFGLSDVLGVDGAYIKRERLLIPHDKFIPMDLERPVSLNRKFDLVLSLEVAEHLRPEYAEAFIDFLVDHGDVVLFSAACPGQGGTAHLNEQWPNYWAQKFLERGYQAIDALRPWLLMHDEVEWWYAQNTILYANQAGRDSIHSLVNLPVFQPETLPILLHHKYFNSMGVRLLLPPRFRTIRKALMLSLSLLSRFFVSDITPNSEARRSSSFSSYDRQ